MFSSPGPGQLQTMPDPIINNRFNTRPVQYPGTFTPTDLDAVFAEDARSMAGTPQFEDFSE